MTPHATAPRKPRRQWLRRLVWSLLLLIVAATVFHRPLIRFSARRVAANFGLALEFQVTGSLFSNLTIENVHAVPNGRRPTPLQRLHIARMHFDYDLRRLVTLGPGEFLRSYEIEHADLAFVALPRDPKTRRPRKLSIARVLRTILAQPAAFADRVRVEDFNLRVTTPKYETRVEGVDILLLPEAPGYLRVRYLAAPRLPVWENLAAPTSYTNRELLVRDLVLAPRLILREIRFDASRRSAQEGLMSARAEAFGGQAEIALSAQQLRSRGEALERDYETFTNVRATGIDLAEAGAYFHWPNLRVRTLTELRGELTGVAEKPRTWKASGTASVNGIVAGWFSTDRATFSIATEAGQARATGEARHAGNTAHVSATAQLPESVLDFPSTDAEATVRIDAPELAAIAPELVDAQSAATAEGTISLHNRIASAQMQATVKASSLRALAFEGAAIVASGSKRFDRPRLGGLSSELQANVRGLRWDTFASDTAEVQVKLDEALLTIPSLVLVRGNNRVSAAGSYEIQARGTPAAAAPFALAFSVAAPDLNAFGLQLGKEMLRGALTGSGGLQQRDGALTGKVELDGAALALGAFQARQFGARIQLDESVVKIADLSLRLQDEENLLLRGQASITAPYRYEGTLHVQMPQLAVLDPLLAAVGVEKTLAGTLKVDWSGRGATDTGHAGDLQLAIDHGRYDQLDLREVRLAGTYAHDAAKTSEFAIRSGSTQLRGEIDFGEGKLRLRDLALQQGAQQVLTGYAIVPFDPLRRTQLFPPTERIAINLNATSLDLEKLSGSLGVTFPLAGMVTASLVTGGTLFAPAGQLQISARSLKSKAAPGFDDAALDATVHFTTQLIELAATVRQREIPSLAINGKLPADLEKIFVERAFDPELPLDFSVRLPATSLASLPKFFPKVRRLEGTAGFDLKVGGTFGKPDVRVGLDVDVKSGRLTAENAPAIGAFSARLHYADEALTFTTCEGELGGGTFKLTGQIEAPELANFSLGPTIRLPTMITPTADLRLVSDEVLILRNDAMIVRADADLRLTGPLASAATSGTVYVVHSRFLKDLDILPIALPNRPKPVPRQAPAAEEKISLPPPLHDWKFDVAVKTRPGDPFAIRGNLANGSASFDLRLAGTGLRPWIEGQVRVEKFSANLPFSTLTVTRGSIIFDDEQPFLPKLDLQAESPTQDLFCDREHLRHRHQSGDPTHQRAAITLGRYCFAARDRHDHG